MVIYGIGSVSGVIVIVIRIVIVNYDCIAMITAIITAVVIRMMTNIDSNRHDRKWHKKGRIKSVVIRRDVRYIGRRIHILYNGC